MKTFNKNPKINHTHEDIQKNHGHAPGLVQKLSAALDHAHKIQPNGIYQADIMHAGDVKHDKANNRVDFTPNTITYIHTNIHTHIHTYIHTYFLVFALSEERNKNKH